MSAATVLHDFHAEIEGLIARGFPLVPIRRGKKKAVPGGWPELQIGLALAVTCSTQNLALLGE